MSDRSSDTLPQPVRIASCLHCGEIECMSPGDCSEELELRSWSPCSSCRGQRFKRQGTGWVQCLTCGGAGLYEVAVTRDIGNASPVLVVEPQRRVAS